MTQHELFSQLTVRPGADQTRDRLRASGSAPAILGLMRRQYPDLGAIPALTYSQYREFEHTGLRDGYQSPYFVRRALLSRAVLEVVYGDDAAIGAVEDLLWAVCEETTWVLPAHEEQGPDYWDLAPPVRRTSPLGPSTALTREPEAIDLFCAETGACLAEAVFLVGAQLAPEVVTRVRNEVDRRVFQPYLASARRHWWFTADLNWSGVCNGAVGTAFLRLWPDTALVAQALELVLEGLEAYLATGFEADGGSVEGIGYWNYGLMYFMVLAEHLKDATNGAVDLAADPRLSAISRYPFVMALKPGHYLAFGDATNDLALEPGVVSRLADRTGTEGLRGLIVEPEKLEATGISQMRLAVVVFDLLWWDGRYRPFPHEVFEDAELADCGVVKKTGKASGEPVLVTLKAGHNDGHHSHTDVGSVVYTVGGESLIDDPGRALYWKGNFRTERYDSLFNNSLGHNVPRIGGRLQNPGPEFGGKRQFYGTITDHGVRAGVKGIEADLGPAYGLPPGTIRRSVVLDPDTGVLEWTDGFDLAEAVEEALVTWYPVVLDGPRATVTGDRWAVDLRLAVPAEAVWTLTEFTQEPQANQREGVLRRLTVQLTPGQKEFRMTLTPRLLNAEARR